MSRLILVRHSAPKCDETLPSTAWGLSEQGKNAAREMADRLGELTLATVLTSPERKARETATIIAAHHGIRVSIDDDLREHERISTGFLPPLEFNRAIEGLLRFPDKLVFGEETSDAVFLRFDAAVKRARSANPHADLLAITHGTAMSIYVGRVFGVDPLAFWHSLTTPIAVILCDQKMQVVSPTGAVVR